MTTAKIYKIESLLTPYIYIGSTTKNYLSERFTYYRSEYKRYLQSKIDKQKYINYIKIKTDFGNEGLIKLFKLFDVYGIKTFKILLLNEICHTSTDNLKAQLYEFIKTIDCINK
jgi:hypothetical protein